MKNLRRFPAITVVLGTFLFPTSTVQAAPSADSITSCTIVEGGVDKGSTYSITFTPGVVQGSQPLISVTANNSSKSVGFEQGYVLKTDLTGTLFTGSQSINVFSSATLTNFDGPWYVDSQKFDPSNTTYPASSYGFQYRFFAVEGTAPYSYNSADTPLCTLTFLTPEEDPNSGEAGGINFDFDLSPYFARSAALPDTR